MNNSLVSKKLVGVFLIIGLLVVIVAIIGSLVGRRQARDDQDEGQNLTQATTIRREVDENKLPDRFPTNFPQESGAKILQNDTQAGEAGRFQATRRYETAKTLAENYKIFQTYFQQNGWKVTASVDEATFKSITATKGDLSIKVALNDNALTKTKTVDLYLIQIIGTK